MVAHQYSLLSRALHNRKQPRFRGQRRRFDGLLDFEVENRPVRAQRWSALRLWTDARCPQWFSRLAGLYVLAWLGITNPMFAHDPGLSTATVRLQQDRLEAV